MGKEMLKDQIYYEKKMLEVVKTFRENLEKNYIAPLEVSIKQQEEYIKRKTLSSIDAEDPKRLPEEINTLKANLDKDKASLATLEEIHKDVKAITDNFSNFSNEKKIKAAKEFFENEIKDNVKSMKIPMGSRKTTLSEDFYLVRKQEFDLLHKEYKNHMDKKPRLTFAQSLVKNTFGLLVNKGAKQYNEKLEKHGIKSFYKPDDEPPPPKLKK